MTFLLQLHARALRLGGRVSTAVLLLGMIGCDRPVARDSAPAELRGEPIRPAAVAAVNVLTSASAGTNRASALAPTAAPIAPVAPVAPVAVAGSAPSATVVSAAGKGEEFAAIGFEKLSGYPFEVPDDLLAPPSNQVAQATARTEAQIPKEVKALDRRRVALKGFMLPLKVEDGSVTELLIMKDQSMCCYGTVPKINEWVSVKMTGAGVKPFMDRPVTFYGTLHVGEIRENGYLVGIYSMDGEKMVEPMDH